MSLADYMAWLRRWAHLFTTYVNLDVIGDAAGTLVNQQRMEDAGLAPVPVFHAGEPWEYLATYCERYPYVALGGMVHSAPEQAMLRWAVGELCGFDAGRTGRAFR